jgi:hypothetical protein
VQLLQVFDCFEIPFALFVSRATSVENARRVRFDDPNGGKNK